MNGWIAWWIDGWMDEWIYILKYMNNLMDSWYRMGESTNKLHKVFLIS